MYELKGPRGVPVAVAGDHAGRTIAQLMSCLADDSAAGGALLADGHYGYSQPVGGVAAYRDKVSVSGVGFDIACGNLAARTTLRAADLTIADRSRIADDIQANVAFGLGRRNEKRVDHPLFDDADPWRDGGVEDLRSLAEGQLGTVGSGNHYVDLLVDEEGLVWIGVHFGSRGLGHKIATRFLRRGGGKDGMDVPPTLLDVGSDLGRSYLTAMRLAGDYAYAGREWVVGEVLSILGLSGNGFQAKWDVTEIVHNHHNFAWLENHGDEASGDRWLWVVRKGATPAFPGQRGFVGGSMGDDAVILEGIEDAAGASEAFLRSTVHGAGRVIGRNAAKKAFRRGEMDRWLAERAVVLRGGGLDESPMAYRRLPDVLGEHETTVRVLHRLRPLVVVMAGAKEFDPYKD